MHAFPWSKHHQGFSLCSKPSMAPLAPPPPSRPPAVTSSSARFGFLIQPGQGLSQQDPAGGLGGASRAHRLEFHPRDLPGGQHAAMASCLQIPPSRCCCCLPSPSLPSPSPSLQLPLATEDCRCLLPSLSCCTLPSFPSSLQRHALANSRGGSATERGA